MSDSKKDIFKLQCTNPECNKIYYSEDLIDVAELWGFIFLTDGEEYIIGLTCVDCQHTVIQNYKILPEDFPFNSKKMEDIRWGPLGYYVPFSPEITETYNENNLPRGKRSDSKKLFSIPDGFQPIIDYPEEFKASFLPIKIHAEDVGALCEFENRPAHPKIKVFPRIVTQNSVYRISDVMMSQFIDNEIFEMYDEYTFNKYYEFGCDEFGKFFANTKTALVSLVTNGFQTKYNPHKQSRTIKYANLIQNDLLSEDYEKMDFELDPWGRPDSSNRERFMIFLQNYQIYRNIKDFELFCYSWLNYVTKPLFSCDNIEDLNIGQFFQEHADSDISPNEVESIFHEIGHLDFLPEKSEFQNMIKNRPFQVKTLSGAKLMARWNLDGYEVVDLILSNNISATDIYGRKPFTQETLNQTDFVALLAGDQVDQKKALRRLRFDPIVIDEFERANPVLFEKIGVKPNKNSDSKAPQREKKIRPSQQHRLAVREMAKKLWAKDPFIRTADMVVKDEITKIFSSRGKDYTEKTLADWIRDLNPNPRRGRPQKEESQ